MTENKLRKRYAMRKELNSGIIVFRRCDNRLKTVSLCAPHVSIHAWFGSSCMVIYNHFHCKLSTTRVV